MRTLDRYLAGMFFRNFFVAVIGLTFLYVFQSFFGDLLDHSYPAHQLLVHNLMNVPQVFTQMTPPGVLIATVFTLSGLNRSNELVALYAIGVGLGRIIMLLLCLVFMICCTSLVFQDRILPPMFKKSTLYYWRDMQKRTDFFLDFQQNKIWYRSKNLIYNLQSFDAKAKSIKGMSVYTLNPQFDLKKVIEAERADYSPEGWQLKNGTVTVFASEDSFPQTQSFLQMNLALTEKPSDFQEIEKEVDGLRLRELWQYIERTKNSGTDTKAYEVKLWSRISLSFIPLVMCILGVPFSTRRRREGGIARDLGLCLAVTFFYWLFYSIGLSLGTNGAMPPAVAAWLPSVVFVAFAAGLIAHQQQNG